MSKFYQAQLMRFLSWSRNLP